MSPSFNGHAFNAALKLAIEGKDQPSGYTEPILHQERLKFKAKRVHIGLHVATLMIKKSMKNI